MKILYVSDVYLPRINGVSTSAETFASALAASGDEVRLIAPDYGNGAGEDWIWRVPARPVPRDPEDRIMSWRRLTGLAPQVAAWAPDLVHVQTPFLAHYAGLRFARALGLPCVATYHTFFEEYLHHYVPALPAGWLRAFARRFSRTQCDALDGVIVPSHGMRERLLAYGVHTPMDILPTGIELARFARGDGSGFRARLGIAPEQPLALYVGRVAHEKNIGFLIRMAGIARHERPDLLLLVTGEGPAREALAAQVERAGLARNVRFIGYLDRYRELPDAYAAADVFVFASRTETQGLVLLEAMAAGTPVLALAEMGTRDILAAQQGCVIGKDSEAGFAAQLTALLADGERRQSLGREARDYAATWSAETLAARLRGFYQRVLAQPRRRSETGSARVAVSN